MFWQSVELVNYLPFTHVGNKKVAISFEAPCTALLGGNGSGKSSLLRALTPLPAVRTDYGTNGKIVKVLSHNGSVYELTSDFSNSSAPHSFIKDGVQLNVGGTTETQRDLVEEHFGFSKMISEIMSGNMQFCTMTKADRKNLFSATYPSDLSFVLEYHKKICGNIRACNNQLKLLRGREASLKAALLGEEERAKLKKFKAAAERIIDGIDKTCLLLENEIKSYKAGDTFLEQCKYNYEGWELLDIRDEILCLRDDIMKLFRKTKIRRKLRDGFDSSHIKILASKHLVTAQVTKDHIEAATQRVSDVRDELNKFIACKEASASASEKSQLEERLADRIREKDEITLKIGTSDVVTIDSDNLGTVENDFLPYLRQWSDEFHSTVTHVLPWKEVFDLGVRLEHARVSLGTDMRRDLIDVTNELSQIKSRLEHLRSRPYPTDCTQICPLRNSFAKMISESEARLEQALARKQDLMKRSDELKKFIDDNSAKYQEQVGFHNKINMILQHLRGLRLESIAFGADDPVDVCNNRVHEIANRVARACELTHLYEQKNALTNEIDAIQQTLKEMANAKQLQLSAELIDQSIADREEKLNQGIKEIEHLEQYASQEEQLGRDIEELGTKFGNLEHRVQDAYHVLNHQRVMDVVEFDRKLIAELSEAKHDIARELYNVGVTLDDQRKHLDILESEIIPTTKKIEKEKHLYEMVADGLSPATGLPCIYLVRFINRLLRRANEVIHDVWLYDMDLVYLKEDEELDFTIPMTIRNNTTIKDISECSKGMSAIVNFALNVAICIERGYFNLYPFAFDEGDANMTEAHRTRLTSLLSKYLDQGVIKQMFLVNHFAVQSGLSQCDCVVLSSEGIVLPEAYNEHAVIE